MKIKQEEVVTTRSMLVKRGGDNGPAHLSVLRESKIMGKVACKVEYGYWRDGGVADVVERRCLK